MTKPLPSEDMTHILTHAHHALDSMRNSRIFITGGTGFFGVWLLETLTAANAQLNLNAKITVLTRNAKKFQQHFPHIACSKDISFLEGDVRHFEFPSEQFTHVIHAATEASATLNAENPIEMLDVILQGTKHTFDFARVCDAKNILFVSSGAIYGRQPPQMTHICEEYTGSPDIEKPASAYGVGKRTAEHLAALYIYQHQLNIKIARCFAFVGPHLPLDAHFAIGNFIRDVLAQKNIEIKGDGTPYRSYQYAADLVIWLLHILCFGEKGVPYNVGSDESVSIKETAEVVAAFSADTQISVAKKADPTILPERYVPSIERAKKELCLKNTILLSDAVLRTLRWHHA